MLRAWSRRWLRHRAKPETPPFAFGNGAARATRSTDFERAEQKSRNRHHCAGVSSADQSIGFRFAHKSRGRRALELSFFRRKALCSRVIVHRDHFAFAGTTSIGRFGMACLANSRVELPPAARRARFARQIHVQPSTLPSTSGTGSMVSAHGINRNCDHVGLRSGNSGKSAGERPPLSLQISFGLRRRTLRPRRLGQLCHCKSRNEGRPGVAASFRGNWGTSRAPA